MTFIENCYSKLRLLVKQNNLQDFLRKSSPTLSTMIGNIIWFLSILINFTFSKHDYSVNLFERSMYPKQFNQFGYNTEILKGLSRLKIILITHETFSHRPIKTLRFLIREKLENLWHNLKYFCIFNNIPLASWIAHITRDFFRCYFCLYYSFMATRLSRCF